jgi:hypothetical protein
MINEMKINLARLIQASFFICILLASAPVMAQQVPGMASPAKDAQEIAFPKASQFAHTKLTYKITAAPNNTFGYDILADDRLMIRQASVPAMPGNEGFKTKAGAEKVAQLVIKKIQKGEMPPTVEIEEMKKIKAIP